MFELLLVVIGAVLGAVVTWLLPNREARELRRQLEESERLRTMEGRDTRIHHVVDQYMQFRRGHITSGLDGLQKAGVATLKSHEEVEEVLRLIVAHGEPHPLGRNHEFMFAGVDLLRLFKYAADNRVNFFTTPIENIIRDSSPKLLLG